jgi:hypothetical protein
VCRELRTPLFGGNLKRQPSTNLQNSSSAK